MVIAIGVAFSLGVGSVSRKLLKLVFAFLINHVVRR